MRMLRKILALLLFVSACVALVTGKGILYALGMVFLSLGVWPGEAAPASGTRGNRELEASEPNPGPLAKARADYAEIQGSMGLIQDKEMTAQLNATSKTATSRPPRMVSRSLRQNPFARPPTKKQVDRRDIKDMDLN